MSKKRNTGGIDYWQLVRFIFAILLTVFLVFNISKKLNTPVDNIKINIGKIVDNKELITKKEIRSILKNELGYDVTIAEVSQLNLFHLEKILNRDDRIAKTDVYLDKHNVLHVSIQQKVPIVRIEVHNETDYYLDYNGDRIPVTDIIRVPVVTGKVDNYTYNFSKQKNNNLNSIIEIARKVNDDEFLNALVEQIYIDQNNEITLVPKVGRDKILLGEINDLDEKIYKLKVYYEKGIKNIGLDKFDELDLKYKGQIIGRNKDT